MSVSAPCQYCGSYGDSRYTRFKIEQLQAENAALKLAMEKREVRPRVHGNGFIQLDLSQSKRLHIFGDPMIPCQVTPTPVHDHTFGFTSQILSGELTNVWYDVEDSKDGTHNVYQARVRDREDTVLENTGRVVRLIERDRKTFRAGESYEMLPGDFHETLINGRTVTIITKDGPSLSQGGSSPRVLVSVGSKPDNDFNRYAESPETLWDIITAGSLVAALRAEIERLK